MKKLTLAISILSLSAASAFAADLPARMYTKAPMMPAYDWSGFYVGANGGWGSSRNCWDLESTAAAGFIGPISEGCHNATGGVARWPDRLPLANRCLCVRHALKGRATGLTSADPIRAASRHLDPA